MAQDRAQDTRTEERIRIEAEAAAFRRLRDHLRERTDVQNIDLMNLASFCRNCLSRWFGEEMEARGRPMTKDEARDDYYGMAFTEWKARYQKDASPEQQAAFAASHKDP